MEVNSRCMILTGPPRQLKLKIVRLVEDITTAINWAAGYTPEVQAGCGSLEMVLDQN